MKKNAKSKLAHVIQKRMKSINQNQSDICSELGTIKNNGNLLLDSINDIIPADEYSKCANCSSLSDGDRVLIIWASGEPIIIDKIGG